MKKGMKQAVGAPRENRTLNPLAKVKDHSSIDCWDLGWQMFSFEIGDLEEKIYLSQKFLLGSVWNFACRSAKHFQKVAIEQRVFLRSNFSRNCKNKVPFVLQVKSQGVIKQRFGKFGYSWQSVFDSRLCKSFCRGLNCIVHLNQKDLWMTFVEKAMFSYLLWRKLRSWQLAHQQKKSS